MSTPFWDATRERRLLVQWCLACDAPCFTRVRCAPAASATDLEWRTSGRHGTVYAVTVEHRPRNLGWRAGRPTRSRSSTSTRGGACSPTSSTAIRRTVTVGMPVTVTWEPLSDGRNLPLFSPPGRQMPELGHWASATPDAARSSGPAERGRSPSSTRTRTGWRGPCGIGGSAPATPSPSSRGNRPEFVETYAACPAGRVPADAGQLASHRRRGRLHRRRLRGEGVRRRRSTLADVARRGSRRSRATARSQLVASAATSKASSAMRMRCTRRVAGDALDDPDARRQRCSTRRARRAAQGRAPDRRRGRDAAARPAAATTSAAATCTCAPARCTTPRRSRSRSRIPLAFGATVVLMEQLGRGGDAAAHRGARRHPHAHGADDVPPAAVAARRRAGASTTSRAALRPARRGAVPGAGEAADHRVARPDRVGVLRRDRRRRQLRRLARRGSNSPGTVGRPFPPDQVDHRRRGRQAAARRRDRARVPQGAGGDALRVLQGRRRRRRRRTEATTSRSATSATSTTTATCSSPTAART